MQSVTTVRCLNQIMRGDYMDNITNEENSILEKYRNTMNHYHSAHTRNNRVSFARVFLRWCNDNNIKVG
jgi:hypothetical protein